MNGRDDRSGATDPGKKPGQDQKNETGENINFSSNESINSPWRQHLKKKGG